MALVLDQTGQGVLSRPGSGRHDIACRQRLRGVEPSDGTHAPAVRLLIQAPRAAGELATTAGIQEESRPEIHPSEGREIMTKHAKPEEVTERDIVEVMTHLDRA